MAIITSFGRETTRVAADNSLVSDMRTCSLISDTENMPGRVNRCDTVRARDLSEIFHLIIALFVSGIMHVLGHLYDAVVWQLLLR